MKTTAPTAEPLSAGIVKRATTMADGRDLIYFDDAGTSLPADRAADARELPPRPATATMRLDPLTGEWISIATARQTRVMLPPKHLDPLAPSTPENPSEVPGDYDVVVFENRSPSFGPEPGTEPTSGAEPTITIGATAPSVGRCEVVCFAPESDGAFSSLPVSRIRTIVEAWADRTAALSQVPGVEQVFVFENRGEAIGVTLHHPHGQIYAYPFVTPRTRALLRSIEAHGPGFFDELLAFEQAGERVLVRGEHFTAFVPFAARWPLEIHVLPHRHIPDLAATSEAERDELAALLPRLTGALDRLYDSPTPYIAAWHQAPVHHGRDEVRLMLQLQSPRRAADKLKFTAGSEAAMGAFVGDVAPEAAAEALRAVLDGGDATTGAR